MITLHPMQKPTPSHPCRGKPETVHPPLKCASRLAGGAERQHGGGRRGKGGRGGGGRRGGGGGDQVVETNTGASSGLIKEEFERGGLDERLLGGDTIVRQEGSGFGLGGGLLRQRPGDRSSSGTSPTTALRTFPSRRHVPHTLEWLLVFLVLLACRLQQVGLAEGKVFATQMSPRVINTQYGKLRGVLVTLPSRHLPLVEAYLGLQYASVLQGELRFMPPTSPMESWDGIRVALKFRPVCPQKVPTEEELLKKLPVGRVEHFKRLMPFLERQAEECLNLNVYVPVRADNETDLLPVILFIHGESYSLGTGNAYDGSVLASFGRVLVVTLNYRLGVLGFLSTGDSNAPGNYALLDQVAALHWIKENIEAFGGDPQEVTLLGQGYGGAMVNLLLVSPVTKGLEGKNLFKRAIIQSGSALSTWAVAKDPLAYTHQLAERVNCSAFLSRSDQLIQCFKNKPVDELINAEITVPKYYSGFAPVVDRRSVLPSDVESLMRKPVSVFGETGILLGVMRNEGFLFFNQTEVDAGVPARRRDRIVRTYVRNVYQYHRQKIYEILMHHYNDWERPSDPSVIRDNLMELLGDGQYAAPMMELTRYHGNYDASTFLYSFTYPSRLDTYPRWAGGVHGDDMTYVFGAPLTDGIDPFTSTFTRSEKMLTEAIMRYWTNFAKTGDPNDPVDQQSKHGGRVKNRFVDLAWPKYNNKKQEYLHIGVQPSSKTTRDFGTRGGEHGVLYQGMRPTVRHHYRGTKIALWLDLIPKLHQSDDLEPKFHLLNNFDNSSTFEEEGTRELDMDVIFPLPPLPPVSPPSLSTLLATPAVTTSRRTTPTTHTTTPRPPTTTPGMTSTRRSVWPRTRPPYTPAPAGAGGSGPTTAAVHPNTSSTVAPHTGAISGRDNTLSLSVTIAVGCSLLFLNILIFAGVYYQKDRMRMEMKLRQRELEKERQTGTECGDLPKSGSGCVGPGGGGGGLLHHSTGGGGCSGGTGEQLVLDANNSSLACTPPAPPPSIARHQVQPQVTTLPKQPIPVMPPQAPYARHTLSGRHPGAPNPGGCGGMVGPRSGSQASVRTELHPDGSATTPRHLSLTTVSPRHASRASTLERDPSKTKLRHSPSADSGTDVNNHPSSNPVTMV